jgi:hypothetical protein
VSEKPPLYIHRRGTFLAPWAPLDELAIAELPPGAKLRAKITQPRNAGRLRLYWSLLSLVAENMEHPPPRETMHAAIKMRLGLTTPVRFKNGETVDVPRSIAFDAMTEAEFAGFFDSFRALVRSNPQMEKAAREMLGEDV